MSTTVPLDVQVATVNHSVNLLGVAVTKLVSMTSSRNASSSSSLVEFGITLTALPESVVVDTISMKKAVPLIAFIQSDSWVANSPDFSLGPDVTVSTNKKPTFQSFNDLRRAVEAFQGIFTTGVGALCVGG